jgi:tetratricopeptide (TPR) repeat protein
LQETGQAFALYTRLLFWPTGLHMERTLDGVPGWLGPLGWVLLAAAALAALAAFSGRRYRIAAGLVWFLAAWAPISGIFPLNAPMAEHWMYVPMAGFWWAVAECLVLAFDRPRLRWVPLVCAGAACAVLITVTAARNRDWHDNERLFLSTLKQNPNSVRVHYNLAVTYEDILKNYAGARRHYEAILRLQGQEGSASGPPRPAMVAEGELRLALGHVLEKLGDPNDAAVQYQKMLTVKKASEPGAGLEAAIGFGRCFLAMGDWPNATQVFAQVVQKAPEAAGPQVKRLLGGAPLGEGF